MNYLLAKDSHEMSNLILSEKKKGQILLSLKKKKKKKYFEIFYFYQKIDLTNVKAHFLGKSQKK